MSEPADTTIPTNDAPISGQGDDAPAQAATILGEDHDQAKGGDQASSEADQDGAKEDAPVLTGAPEKYEFAMPEGVELDTEALAAVEPILREMDLSQEAAGKIVNAYAEKVLPVLTARAEAQGIAAAKELVAGWAKATMDDPEVGGAQLTESKAMAARAMKHVIPDDKEGQEFRTFLNESGLGNHVQMVRFMARVGRQLGEAKSDSTNTNPAPASREEKYYGKKG